MVPDLVPIVVPVINWNEFLKVANDALGYSPVRIVDSCPRQLSDPARFVAVAASFQDRNVTNVVESLRDSLDLIQHLQFVFCVYSDTETMIQIRARTDLKITVTEAVDGERIAIVSGNLKEWYNATLVCCQQRQPFNLRVLFDRFVLFFEQAGLGDIWWTHKKRSLPDHTFLLEHKNE